MSKLRKARGLFDDQDRLLELSKMKDPLEKLSSVIDWGELEVILSSVFKSEKKSKAGRKAYDRLMMFKILVISKYYGITHETLEFQIKDRLSFQRFLGLRLSDRVPDANTIWDFKEALTKAGAFDKLFDRLGEILESGGHIIHSGSIVDASIISSPIQRNSRDENAELKSGKIPKDWGKNKLAQKDLDADWTKKNGKNHYGYKNHIKIDSKSKLITECQITPASVHDSQVLEDLITKDDQGHTLYADSAYRSKEIEAMLKAKKIRSRIHKKGYRGKPLTERDREINTSKSRIRARVEHIFGNIRQRIGPPSASAVGLKRNASDIILMNFVYNLSRLTYLS